MGNGPRRAKATRGGKKKGVYEGKGHCGAQDRLDIVSVRGLESDLEKSTSVLISSLGGAKKGTIWLKGQGTSSNPPGFFLGEGKKPENKLFFQELVKTVS